MSFNCLFIHFDSCRLYTLAMFSRNLHLPFGYYQPIIIRFRKCFLEVRLLLQNLKKIGSDGHI